MKPSVDLHIHSVFSDGSSTVSEICEQAVQRGVQTIALSDHDTTAGIASMQAAVDAVDGQMSLWNADSDLMRLNRAPVGTWPQMTTIGMESAMQSRTGVTQFVAPGPEVTITTPTRPLAQVADAARRFLVQVGVFSNHANAEELVTRLQQAGIPAQIESRVQVGPFASRAEADAARAKLKTLGIDDGLLVRR